jgi:hypothetical protein
MCDLCGVRLTACDFSLSALTLELSLERQGSNFRLLVISAL